MVAALTQAWLGRYRELATELPACPGATGTVQHLVPKGPDGDVAYVVELADGRVVRAELGTDATAALTLTMTHPDALAIARGELDLVAGFMQGRVKLTGDHAVFLGLQGVLQGDAHRSVVAALGAETD